MLDNTINLACYRRSQKEKWFAKNHQKLSLFIGEFLAHNFDVNYQQVAQTYQNMRSLEMEESWDYTDLRDIIHQTIDTKFYEQIYGKLRKCHWFDYRLFSRDEVIEFCLSLYITSSLDSSSSGF